MSGDIRASAYLAQRRPRYALTARTFVSAPLADVFEFFSQTREPRRHHTGKHGLPHHDRYPDPMEEGTEISYRLRVGGVPLHVEDAHRRMGARRSVRRCADRAARIACWWHEHRFDSGRRMTDDHGGSRPLRAAARDRRAPGQPPLHQELAAGDLLVPIRRDPTAFRRSDSGGGRNVGRFMSESRGAPDCFDRPCASASSRSTQEPVRPERDYVLYWMTAFRRTTLQLRAAARGGMGGRTCSKPLIVLEALRVDYPWASDRFHRFILDGMADNRADFARSSAAYYPYVEREPGRRQGAAERVGCPRLRRRDGRLPGVLPSSRRGRCSASRSTY